MKKKNLHGKLKAWCTAAPQKISTGLHKFVVLVEGGGGGGGVGPQPLILLMPETIGFSFWTDNKFIRNVEEKKSIRSSARSTFLKVNVRPGKQPFVMSQMARMTAQYLSLVPDNALSRLSGFHLPVPALSLSPSKHVEAAGSIFFAQDAVSRGQKQADF